jgi:polar amino acid transport system substrate-binding protein
MPARLTGAVLAALLIAACGADGGGTPAASEDCTPRHPGLELVEDGRLTVAVYEYPPYSTYENGELGGAEGELVTRMAELECLDVNVLYVQAAGTIPAVTSGRADVAIGSWYRTAERAEVVLLGAPIVKDEMTIVSSEDARAETIQELKGKRVGAVVGYLWVEDLQRLLGDGLKLYQSTDATYQDLANGRLDAVIDGGVSVPLQLEKFGIPDAVVSVPPPDESVTASTAPGQPQMPVNKDNPGLRRALDENLAELRENGELRRILKENGFPDSAADPGPPNLL